MALLRHERLCLSLHAVLTADHVFELGIHIVAVGLIVVLFIPLHHMLLVQVFLQIHDQLNLFRQFWSRRLGLDL